MLRLPDHMFGMQTGFFLLICLDGALALAFIAAAAIRPWSARRGDHLSSTHAAVLLGDDRRAVVAALAYLRASGAITVRRGKVAASALCAAGFRRLEAAIFYDIKAQEMESLDQLLQHHDVRDELRNLREREVESYAEPEIFTNIRRTIGITVALVTVAVGILFLWRAAWGFLIGGPATVLMLLVTDSWPAPSTDISRQLANFQARMAEHRDEPPNECDPEVAAGLVAAYGEDVLWDADPALRAVLARPHDDYHGRHRRRLVA